MQRRLLFAIYRCAEREGVERPAEPVRSNGLLWVSSASSPTFRVSSAVEDGVDDDLRPADFEEDAVREAPK